MSTYVVYCATDKHGATYYGFTKDLEKRKREHCRSFYQCKSHTSRDMLSLHARKTNQHPNTWIYNVLFFCNDKPMALRIKKECVRNDPNSINYIYKYTDD